MQCIRGTVIFKIEQLHVQAYVDTRDLAIAVYVPVHSPLAKAALKRSVHQNFQVFHNFAGITQRKCDVVIIMAEDVFVPGKKRALVLSHEFSMTGAPLVLVNVIPVLRSMGFDVVVLGPATGAAMEIFLNHGVPVIVNAEKMKDASIFAVALSADLIWANTVVEAEAVSRLNGAPVPVIWWLHDAFIGYTSWLSQLIMEHQMPNVAIYAVGERAEAAMHTYRADFKIGQLLYGLPDYVNDEKSERELFISENRVKFACIGSIEERKGHDILVDAILQLPEKELEKAQFLFVGKVFAESIHKKILKLTKRYPKNVFYIPHLSREEIKTLMTQCDCLICPSRDDPMPTVVTEAAMFGKPAILSEHTGFAGLVTNGKDGFVYCCNDAEALCKQILCAIRMPEQLKGMQDACRQLYESHFSLAAFEKNVKNYVENSLYGNGSL